MTSKKNISILKPNFFVVGAPKCGTTSLYYYLKQHPQVYLPKKKKEIHYFSYPEVANTYYGGHDYPTSLEQYLSYYKDVNLKTHISCGDISPSYLYNLKAASRIKEFNSKSKIIIILRNPVERTISHYLMDVQQGYAKLPLIEYIENPTRYINHYKEYVGCSLYYESIENYLNHFPKDQLLVLNQNDLKTNVEHTFEKILDFLELSKSPVIDMSVEHFKYTNYKVNFNRLRNNYAIVSRIISRLPTSVKDFAKDKLASNHTKPDFSDELLEELCFHFKSDVERTNKLISLYQDDWKPLEL